MSNNIRSRFATALAATVMLLAGRAAADTVTLQFNLTEVPLGIFGVQFTADHLTPVAKIAGGEVVNVRFHLEFDTTIAPNPFADAAALAIEFQPPAGDLPFLTVTGADMGWSGTGQFIGDFEFTDLGLPVLDFQPGDEFALWFIRIYSSDDDNPLLGGQLSNSYIEVDVAIIPAPAGLALFLTAPALLTSRRRRDVK